MNGDQSIPVVAGTYALIGPPLARAVLRAIERAGREFRRNGSAPPAEWDEIERVLSGVAFADGMHPMPIRRPPVESAVSFEDPITPTQAAFLLGITPRGVRDLCGRGTLETAQRRPGGWVIERAEVLARAASRST